MKDVFAPPVIRAVATAGSIDPPFFSSIREFFTLVIFECKLPFFSIHAAVNIPGTINYSINGRYINKPFA